MTPEPFYSRNIQLHRNHWFWWFPAKKTGGGAPLGRAEGVYIAMGIRVFGVRGSKGTSTEKGITVAFSDFFPGSGRQYPE